MHESGYPLGFSKYNPFRSTWHHRNLILRLVRREIEARYKGANFGLLWTVFTPILMLCTYTFVFTYIFNPRWTVPDGAEANFVVLLYSGLLIYSLFSECIGRAPGLVLENASYVKKVVFPLEVVAVVSLLNSLVNFVIGSVILMLIYVFLFGLPPATTLLLPLIILPLCLFTVGVSWIISALGVYIRDLSHITTVIISMLMFLSPIFYPISALPEALHPILMASPLTPTLEGAKDVLFWGKIPSLTQLALTYVISGVIFTLGFTLFQKLRKGFADVL